MPALAFVSRKRIAQSIAVSRQQGASLIEALLFLLIAALVAIGIFAIFTTTMASSKSQTEGGYMQAIVAATEQLYATNNSYGTGDLTTTLVTTKSAPAPMIVGTGLQNSWGGAVTVTGATSTFLLTSTGVPKKECILLSQISISETALSINGAAQTLPISPATAAAGCNTESNSIAWNIR